MKGKTEIQFNQRNPKFSTPYFQIKQNSCNKYDGSYLKDGFGQLEWPDGRSYKGEWQNNKQHRVGIYVGYNGIEKEGEWVEGKLIRWNKSKARLSII